MGQTETVSDYATSRNNAWNAYCVYVCVRVSVICTASHHTVQL